MKPSWVSKCKNLEAGSHSAVWLVLKTRIFGVFLVWRTTKTYKINKLYRLVPHLSSVTWSKTGSHWFRKWSLSIRIFFYLQFGNFDQEKYDSKNGRFRNEFNTFFLPEIPNISCFYSSSSHFRALLFLAWNEPY